MNTRDRERLLLRHRLLTKVQVSCLAGMTLSLLVAAGCLITMIYWSEPFLGSLFGTGLILFGTCALGLLISAISRDVIDRL